MSPKENLKRLNLELPEAVLPIGSYVPFKQAGNFIHLSGQGPFINGKSIYTGKVGENVTKEQAYEAAKICGLNLLSHLSLAAGSLDNIKQIVSVRGFVACTNDFTEHPFVINGVSDLLIEVFGEAGKHARVAVGTNVLPVDIPVEIELIAEIDYI